jgi:hypothetical protein
MSALRSFGLTWREQGESFRADRYKSIEGLSLERMKAMAILKGPTLETLHQLEEAPNSLEYDVNHVRRRLVSLSAGQGQVRFITQPKSMTMRATSTRQPELDLSLHSMPVPPSVRATTQCHNRRPRLWPESRLGAHGGLAGH